MPYHSIPLILLFISSSLLPPSLSLILLPSLSSFLHFYLTSFYPFSPPCFFHFSFLIHFFHSILPSLYDMCRHRSLYVAALRCTVYRLKRIRQSKIFQWCSSRSKSPHPSQPDINRSDRSVGDRRGESRGGNKGQGRGEGRREELGRGRGEGKRGEKRDRGA